MAFQQVPNTVEIAVHYTLGGQPLVNTYHAQASGGYDQSLIDALASAIDGGAVSDLLVDQSVHLAYTKTVVRGLDQINDIVSEVDTNAGLGGVAQQSLPGDRAFCVTRGSGLTGRSARGRVYVAGIPISALAPGTADVGLITAAYANAYEGHIDGFRQEIETIPQWDAVIVSRYSGGLKRSVAETFQWTVTGYSDRTLDVRRSRKR